MDYFQLPRPKRISCLNNMFPLNLHFKSQCKKIERSPIFQSSYLAKSYCKAKKKTKSS